MFQTSKSKGKAPALGIIFIYLRSKYKSSIAKVEREEDMPSETRDVIKCYKASGPREREWVLVQEPWVLGRGKTDGIDTFKQICSGCCVDSRLCSGSK